MKKLGWLTVIFALTIILSSCGFLPVGEDEYFEKYSKGDPEITIKQDFDEYADGALYDFGYVMSDDYVTFTIYNEGEGNLELTGSPVIRVEGTHASTYIVDNYPETTIGPGESSDFVIMFDYMMSYEYKYADIIIENNDPDEEDYLISLEGRDGM